MRGDCRRVSKSAPDQSLADHGPDAIASRGLTYPFGETVPDYGAVVEIVPGVGWTRQLVPGSLKHINCWLLDDGDGIAVVDTGLHLPHTAENWDKALADRKVTRVICTHFHPDHVGAAGTLCAQHGVPLWMTRGEWLTARFLVADVQDSQPPEVTAMRRGAGWSDEQMADAAKRGWGSFRNIVSAMPAGFTRLQDGDRVRIGAGEWRVVTGSGHSPEHACLVDDARRLMIAGDQVLPRITSNVSLGVMEPDGDPLGEWLASIAKLHALPEDLLVLPAHGEPFTGLHARLERLAKGHRDGLDRLAAHIRDEPKRAVDCFSPLFKRPIDGSVLGLATGETLAHLRHLERRGRAVREDREGVWWWRAS